MSSRTTTNLLRLIAAIVPGVLLQIGHRFQPILIPTVMDIVAFFRRTGSLAEVASNVALTAGTALSSLLAADLWALPLGLMMGISTTIREAFMAPVDFARSVPASTLIPLGILLMGPHRIMFFTVTTVAVGFVLLIIVREYIASLPPTKLSMLRGRRGLTKRTFRVIIPAALPAVSASAQLLVSLSLALIVVCEMLLGSGGIGDRIQQARYTMDSAALYAWMILAGLLGVALSFLLRCGIEILEKRFYCPLRFPDD